MYRKNKNPFQKEKRTDGHIGTDRLDDADRHLLRRYRIEIHSDMRFNHHGCMDSAARLCNGEYKCAEAREATSEIRAKNR